MVSSGDKGTLIFRIKLAQKCEELKLVTADGETNPCILSAGIILLKVSCITIKV